MNADWSLAAGNLLVSPVQERYDLLAEPVAKACAALADADLARVGVAEIDPGFADTAAFCAEYGSPLELSANCVVVVGKRAGAARYAACLIPATTRADVNGVVKRWMDVRKASFAPVADVVARTGMEYGGITPFGLPEDWPVLVDPAVASAPALVVGSGLRRSKIIVSGGVLAGLSGSDTVPELGKSV